MSNPFEIRLCDSATLLHVAQQADKFEFNRRANAEKLLADIDLDGIHVIQCMVPYHRASIGMPSREPLWPDHHRCYVFCKINGQEEPVNFWLDIETAKFDLMMTESELRAKENDPISVGIANAMASAGNEEDE